MDSTSALALVLPATMAIFACAFLALSRLNMPAARAFGLGLAACAAGFTTSALLAPPPLAAFVSDFLFVAGFFFYAEAYLIHFFMPLYRRERLAFTAIYLVMNAFVVLWLGSLHLELLLNDITTSCLLGFALVKVMNRAATTAERAVLLVGSIVVVDNLIRVLIFVYFANSSDRLEDFGQSFYAHAMHVSTSIIGVFYVLSIAAALTDRLIGQLRHAAERDPLTGLFNRRGFDAAMSLAIRGGGPKGAILACDIDYFKRINDRFGHPAGDQVIQTLADAMRRLLPVNAVSARFGGEEFVSFLPGVSLAEAGIVAQMLRTRFAAQDWRFMGIDQQITASFGVAAVAADEVSAKEAIKRADRALYDAKGAGRNRVVWDGGNYEPDGSVVDIQKSIKGEARRSGEGS